MTQTHDVTSIAAMPLLLPTVASLIEDVLPRALEYCAKKMKLAGAEAALRRLQKNDCTARSYFHYWLARQLAETLASLDESIDAVYASEPDETPEDVCLAEKRWPAPIHVIVLAETRSGALTELAAELDRTMAQEYSALLGTDEPVQALDIQVVDAADVLARRGFGAVLASIYNPPLRLWERQRDPSL